MEASEYRCKLIENIVCHEKEEVELFTEQEIITAIQSLNANKVSDEYGIAAEHVKYASTTLAPVLASLFNTILDHGQIPDSFKTGYITPIHKKKAKIHN